LKRNAWRKGKGVNVCSRIDFGFEPLFLKKIFCPRQKNIDSEALMHRRENGNCIFLCFWASVANKKSPQGIKKLLLINILAHELFGGNQG
jgi:hypothetical protein